MTTKAERTSRYIIETVAPIFNKLGYAGTSISDLTEATGLTKGALYGNFANKEELALMAFNHNVRLVIWSIAEKVNAESSAERKLRAITDFYRREYLNYADKIGGCPILNVGIDTYQQNPILFHRVKEIMKKIKGDLKTIISEGIQSGEFRKDLNSEAQAGKIFAMINGSVFLSVTNNDPDYVTDMMDHIDDFISSLLIS